MVKHLTKEGLEKLKKELDHLKTVVRKEVQARIRQSAAHGDLKEKWGTRLNKKGEEVPIHDLWGVRCTQCDEILHTDDGQRAVCPRHPSEVYAIPENTITPL